MRSKSVAKTAALIGAVAVFVVLAFGLRMRNWMPFVGAGFAYLALLLALWPKRQAQARLPDGVERTQYNLALDRLATGAGDLRALAARGPATVRPVFTRMADMLDLIARHHKANPQHVNRTRSFIRSTLGRIVEAARDYVDLAERLGPDQQDRLDTIARTLEDFVPVLEKIDQACLDDDLTALEINVEVLDQQLDRDR